MSRNASFTLTDSGNLRIHIPMHFRQIGGRKRIVVPEAPNDGDPGPTREVHSALVQALGRAFAWTEAIENGTVMSISDLARNLDVDNSYVVRIMKLTTLAPGIIDAILGGEELHGLTLTRLSRSFPADWDSQLELFGFR